MQNKRVLLLFKALLTLGCLLAISFSGMAQNGVLNEQANAAGIPFARVDVCSAGATINLTATPPCTPPASLCTDRTCGTALPQPLTTDSIGNISIYAVAGPYVRCFSAPGYKTKCNDIIIPTDVSSPLGSLTGLNAPIGWAAGAGALTHILGPNDQPLTIGSLNNQNIVFSPNGSGTVKLLQWNFNKFLWTSAESLSVVNAKCVAAGGGNIYAVGNVSAPSQVFGQISTHTICNLIITTGSKATLSGVDASGMGWCWANGGGIYGESHGHGNGFFPNASMLDVAGGVNPVWGFTNCRHSGQDQTFSVADIIFIHQSGTVGSAPWVLFENNGMFSGTSFQDVLFYSGNNAVTNATWFSDTNPIPSTSPVSIVTLASNGSGVCTVTTRTPDSSPGTATPPYTHFVWMVPLSGGEGQAAQVTVSGAVESGFNLTKTAVTGISDSNHFTYNCPSAAPNTTATGTKSYLVFNDAGGNNLAINTEHLYKHVNGGTGTSPGARPFLVWEIGSVGACGANGGLYYDGFEADNSIGAANFEMKAYNSLSPYGDICGNGSNVFRNVNLKNGHIENGNAGGYGFKIQDCKNCLFDGLSGSGGTGSTFMDISSSGATSNVAGLQVRNIVAGNHLNLLVDNINSKTFDVATYPSLSQWDPYGYEDTAGNRVKVGGSLTVPTFKTNNLLLSATAPTVSSGFGTSPSIPSNNGTAAFTLNVGTGGTATNGVIGLPTATTGWNCSCTDITTNSATVFACKQTASSTTTATIGNFNTSAAAAAWVASDILRVSCFAY